MDERIHEYDAGIGRDIVREIQIACKSLKGYCQGYTSDRRQILYQIDKIICFVLFFSCFFFFDNFNNNVSLTHAY